MDYFRRMVLTRERQPGDGEIGIADGLDLLYAVASHDPVECREAGVQFIYELLWREPLTHGGEALEIRKQHRHIIE